jgi:ATP-binding cassette subfamily B protein
VSFRIAPGETLALLGRPGAGKSTLVQLLLRLYDYEHGSIRLDGRELKTLSRRSVRAQIGVVMQEPFLYSKTIGANLQLGRSTATKDEIVASASAADIHGSIEEFEKGYDTLVGERGVTLSGGQRQRVALARALLKDAPILVLDDALSSVDTETEGRILEALRHRRGRRTTILIAHRLSSVRHADRILVLDQGAVVQAGTHGALLKEDGPYRRLWRIQQETGEPVGRPS